MIIRAKIDSIDQILPCYTEADAIGSDVQNLQKLFQEAGYSSNIFTELPSKGALSLEDFQRQTTKNSMVLHHFSTGSGIPHALLFSPAFKITRYHNITPPKYFGYPDEEFHRQACYKGYEQAPVVKFLTHSSWPVSAFNETFLELMQFPQGKILPLLKAYGQMLQLKHNPEISRIFQDTSKKTLLFVGRVVPNKCCHDLLVYLKLYKDFKHEKTRLVLVGKNQDGYGKERIPKLAKELGLTIASGLTNAEDADVVLTGSVDDATLATYYHHADAFISASEHEGFCAPLIEAMFFKKPILAHPSSAIPETLGESGLLVDKTQSPPLFLEGVHKILFDDELRLTLAEKMAKRVQDFGWEALSKKFSGVFEKTLKEYDSFF